MTRRERRAAMALGAVLFVSYAYFYQAGGWNQNSRFAMVRAILERHTLQIDAYQLHTGDRSVWRDHYYSDKAPGASLTALLPVQVARLVSRAAGVDPESFPGIGWTSYVATVATSGLFTVVAALGVFWLSLRWGATLYAALFAATAYGVASPAWAYATLFMGHGQTAGCLMIAFVAAELLGPSPPGRDGPRRTTPRTLAAIIGLSGGWAVVTEFPAAIPAVFIGLFALDQVRRREPAELLPVVLAIAGGIVVAAAPLLAYNAVAFDSPWRLGYSSEEGFKEMQRGFFGITYPRLSAIRELLIGRYRGLLPLSPLMALAAGGLAQLARRGRAAGAAVAAAIGVYYLLLNASYVFWEGGWIFGPRHLSASLPFLALGLAPLWDAVRSGWRALLVAGWMCGAAVTLVAVSTTAQPPASIKAPVQELLWPAFRDGDLSLNHQSFVHGGANADRLRGGTEHHYAWNLGEVAGLHALSSLLPLMAVWIAAAALLLWLI